MSFLFKYKRVMVLVVVVLFSLLSLRYYLSSKEAEAYKRGFNDSNSQWLIKSEEYKKVIDKKLSDNKKLNSDLVVINEQKKKVEETLRDSIKSKQLEYNRTKESLNKCIDDDFISIYNRSLGEKGAP